MTTLSDLRALEAAATKGPWIIDKEFPADICEDATGNPLVNTEGDVEPEVSIVNAEFLCAARNALPALLDLAQRWEAWKEAKAARQSYKMLQAWSAPEHDKRVRDAESALAEWRME